LDEVNNTNGIGHEVTDFSEREHKAPPSPPRGLIERLERMLAVFSKWATVIAGVALTAMLVISVADVIGNKIFHHPIQGTTDYVSFLAVITIIFSLSYSLIEKAHVQIDLFLNKLPRRVKAIFEIFIALLSLTLFVLLTWFSVRYGIRLQKNNELSMTQRIPVFPFAYAVAFACLPACLYLFLEVLRAIKKLVGK
jgi:TRAP-type C4-dicarboxylate transport system permease small subunit